MGDVTSGMVVSAMNEIMNAGWHYRFGAEVGASDPREKQIDCSEATERAVRRAADRAGSSLRLTDGSFAQYDACARAGTLISLEQARNTPGALVFLSRVPNVRPGMGRNGIYHVGMTLNRDTVLEACCSNGDPIRPVAFSRRNWYKEGGLIPGVVYQGAAPPPSSWDSNGAFHRNLSRKDPMMRGEDVKWVQGKVGVAADGIFGDGTKAGVLSWQQAHGLTADGVVGPATAGAMGMPGAAPAPAPAPSGGSLGAFPLPGGHWFGQKSSDARNHSGAGKAADHPDRAAIRRIQARLAMPQQDGLYGPRTEAAVVSFQRGHGLAADGDVGPVTWGAM